MVVVYDAVESSLKHSSRPQRSKSFSRSERSENRDTDLSQSRSRLSAESATSGAISAVGSDNYPSRSSMEKGKAIKLFRPSSDRDATLSSDAVSRVTTSRKGPGSQSDSINDSFIQDPEVRPHLSSAMSTIRLSLPEESNFMQDFDDLMRSGDTMKVSLTPDRLRSMEVRLESNLSPHKHLNLSRRPRSSNNNSDNYSRVPDEEGKIPPMNTLEHSPLPMLTVVMLSHLVSNIMTLGSHCHRLMLMLIPSSKMRNLGRVLYYLPQRYSLIR
jgi:hypothetical protein